MTDTAKPYSAAWPLSTPAAAFVKWLAGLFKRLCDICSAGLGLLLLSPLFLVLAALIKRDSPGPVFFRGPRLGRGGRAFGILKFRTMYERPESYAGPCVTAQDDQRVTRLGKWLRDTKLNELPQLWNVLVGDMSLVGPRPEDPALAAEWPRPVRNEILSVRPGITSPASVLYRDEESLLKTGSLMDTYFSSIAPSKLRLDQLYVRHRSLWLDLDILFWTALVLLPKIKAYTPPEEMLFLGPLSRFVRRFVSWYLADTLIVLAALALTGSVWRLFGPLDAGLLRALGIAVIFSLVFTLVSALMGLNRNAWSRARPEDALSLLAALSAALLAVLLVNEVGTRHFWRDPLHIFHLSAYDDHPPTLPPYMLLTASGLAYFGMLVARYRDRLVTGAAARWLRMSGRAAAARERVLIVGGGGTGQVVSWLLSHSFPSRGFQVMGFVDDDLYKQGSRIQGVDVIGRRADIPRLVARHDIGIIIYAIHNISPAESQELLEICASTPARLFAMPDLMGALNAILVSPPGQSRGRSQDPDPALGQAAAPAPDVAAAPGDAPWRLPGKLPGIFHSVKPEPAAPAPSEPIAPAFIPAADGAALAYTSLAAVPVTALTPCDQCLTRRSPSQLIAWIDELTELSAQGSSPALRARIHEIHTLAHTTPPEKVYIGDS